MQRSRWRPIHATFALALAAVAGCGQNSHPYYPLEPGTFWLYSVETTILDEVRTSRVSITNLDAGSDRDGVVYRQRHQPALDRYLRITDRGLERRDKHGGAFSLQLPRVFEVGSRWTVMSDLALIESRTFARRDRLGGRLQPVELEMVVTSDDDRVETPAGRFDGCVRVEGRGVTTVRTDRGNASGRVTVDQTDWYAPAVGLVRSTRSESSDSPFLKDGRYRQELIAFGH